VKCQQGAGLNSWRLWLFSKIGSVLQRDMVDLGAMPLFILNNTSLFLDLFWRAESKEI
jgi:hypothetical protein